MKTTLELPGDLLRRVKARAAMQGRSMKDVIAEALEEKLAPSGTTRGWRAVFGKAKPAAVADVDRRIRELDRIDPADWR